MTARHMRDALICGAYRGDYRVGAVAATMDEDYEPAVLAPVAIGFTEAEVTALARHLMSDMEWVPSESALIAARDTIFAAADDIEKEKDA